MSETTDRPTVSYCVQCDALPGKCAHTGPRYLDPIVYEATEESGWRVPDTERKRWDYNGWVGGKRTDGNDLERAAPQLLRDLLIALEPIVLLDEQLRALIADSYEANAFQTGLAIDSVRKRASDLQNPSGWLVKRLREILK